MTEGNASPPEGVEIIPDDVNDELNKIEMAAHKKLIQKVMDDPEFATKYRDDPRGTLGDWALAEELGVADEVEGHARWNSKWRNHWHYGWMHYTRRGGWEFRRTFG